MVGTVILPVALRSKHRRKLRFPKHTKNNILHWKVQTKISQKSSVIYHGMSRGMSHSASHGFAHIRSVTWGEGTPLQATTTTWGYPTPTETLVTFCRYSPRLINISHFAFHKFGTWTNDRLSFKVSHFTAQILRVDIQIKPQYVQEFSGISG